MLVLGGGYAGLTAAARLGEADPRAAITLIDAKPQFVERIRLHEVAAGSEPRALPYEPFLRARNVGFMQARVTALDPANKRVALVRADGSASELGYDYLIYGLGSGTDLAAVPGAAQYAIGLDSVAAARSAGSDVGAARILVVGGGLTAIEAAAEFAERRPDARITLAAGATFGPHPGPGGLASDAFGHIQALLERRDVVLLRTRVTTLRPGLALLASGEAAPFDICVWCAGFRASPVAVAAGMAVDHAGAIRTDATLRSISHQDIVAVGDGADARTELGGKCRMSCAVGRPMGAAAAETILALLAGEPPPAFTFGYVFRCISLGRTDGLIQFVNPDDSPRPDFWTGARAARWKEYICRRTLQGIGFDMQLGPPPDVPP